MSRLTHRLYSRAHFPRVERYLAALLPHAEAFAELAVEVSGKLVLVSLRRATAADPFGRLISVHWLPDQGPAPSFSGHLSIAPRDGTLGTVMMLDGEYAPLPDVRRRAFDGTLVRSLAEGIAAALMQALSQTTVGVAGARGA